MTKNNEATSETAISQLIRAAKGESIARRSLTLRIVELLWTDAGIMHSFALGNRGWQPRIAERLGVDREALNAHIRTIGGLDALKHYASGNPIGQPPYMASSSPDIDPLKRHMNNTYFGCASSGCPTCGCPSSGCATSDCASMRCGISDKVPTLEAA